MTSERRLRVALVVESELVPAWIAALVARLSAAPGIDLEVVALGRRQARGRQPLLLRAYERIDSLLFRWPLDALEPRRIDVASWPAQGFDGLDVAVDLATTDPASLAAEARYGVWAVSHEPPTWQSTGPLYATLLHAHFPDGRRVLLDRSYGATDPASPGRTRHQALWRAQGTIADRLESIRLLGLERVETRARRTGHADPGLVPRRRLSSMVVAVRAARAAVLVTGRLLRNVVQREAWFVATRARPPSMGDAVLDGRARFDPIEWPSPIVLADPFIFEHGGDTYLFCEDDSDHRGKIVCVRLGADGKPTTPPAVVLEAPYHLSYPFVFLHEGDVFMIPESSANRTVEIYRARPFPHAWSLERVLLHDTRAFDATLHVGDQRLWLFVTIADDGAMPSDELHLFSAETLTGPWVQHPANPVVSDVRSARPAGRIFRHGDDWIRPSQDCSRRYGWAIVFNRIDVLTEDDYVETPIGRLEPDWHPGVIATHTYNFGESIEVVDGKRRVLRRPFARLRG